MIYTFYFTFEQENKITLPTRYHGFKIFDEKININ